MAKPEWGIKRICPNCGARYYDLRKDPPVCPSCSTTFDPEALLRSRRSRPVPVEEPPRKAPAVSEDEEVLDRGDVEVDGNDEDVGVDDIEEDADDTTQEEDEVMIEDASELGEEDDMGVDVDGDEEEP